MADRNLEVDPYLMREIYDYSTTKINSGKNVMIVELIAKLSQYEQDEVLNALATLDNEGIIQMRNHAAFGAGRQFLKWRDEMSPQNVLSSPTINIGSVHGHAHFGQGDINITNNDAEAIVALVRELSKTTTDKTLGDKISDVLSGASGATTIVQGLIQLGAALL